MTLRRLDPLVPVWLLVPLVVWGSHGFHGALSRDPAFYVYAGQEVAAGEPPYVGLMNRVGPLAHLLPGLGVWLGRATGVGDVVGVRVVFFALAVLTPALVYLVLRTAFGSRIAGSVGAASLVSFEGYALIATNGPQSKQPMVALLLLALLLLMHRRMLLAGVATGLATLTWQPVLFAAAAAALVMALTAPGGWRPKAVASAWFALGGALTLAVTVGYFTAVDALDAFLDGFLIANLGYTEQPTFLGNLTRSWHLIKGFLGWTTWPFLIGMASWLPLAGRALRPAGDPMVRHRTLALGAATLGAVGWSLKAYSGEADTMLLLPGAALGLGGAAAVLAATARRRRWSGAALLAGGTVWVLVATAVTLQTTVSARTSALDRMESSTRAAFAALPDDATFFSHSRPQPLALSGRRNLTRYLLYGLGMSSWIDDEWPGGLKAYAAWVREQQPTVLVVPLGGFHGFLEPLRSDYRRAGAGLRWRILLHESVDPAVRREVAEALAPGGAG